MAKTTSVTPPSKPFISTNPSLLDCVEEKEEPKVKEGNEFELFMSKLKGETKRHLMALVSAPRWLPDTSKMHHYFISSFTPIH